MMNDTFRTPREEELHRVSAQIAKSYKAAYREMMKPEYLDTITDSHWVSILQESAQRGDHCIIAEHGDEIVGSIVYGQSEDNPDTVYLHAIYLVPHRIGQGLGHRLYCTMEADIRKKGCSICKLEVLVQNEPAIMFYLDHGFSIEHYFSVLENGMELDCYTMTKELSASDVI